MNEDTATRVLVFYGITARNWQRSALHHSFAIVAAGNYR